MNPERREAVVLKTANQMLQDALYEFDFSSSYKIKDALEMGADPNGRIITADSWLIAETAMDTIKKAGVDKNKWDVDLLTYAIDRHMYSMDGAEIVDLLLAYGANPNANNGNRFDKLTIGKFRSPYHAVMYSRDQFYKITGVGDQDEFLKERTRVLESLILHGADPIPINENGETVLHITAYSVNMERIAWLSSIDSFMPHFKAMLQHKDIKGMTPLGRMALITTPFDAEEHVYRCYAALVQHGAEMQIKISDEHESTIEQELINNKFHEPCRRLIALQVSLRNPVSYDNNMRPRAL